MENPNRRNALGLATLTGAAVLAVPSHWLKPVINVIDLPAHAQTSVAMCVTDLTLGGPLIGNPSGASSCQAACEDIAVDQNAQLCEVREQTDSSNAVQCECDLDLP